MTTKKDAVTEGKAQAIHNKKRRYMNYFIW